jgi:hypothetical protein
MSETTFTAGDIVTFSPELAEKIGYARAVVTPELTFKPIEDNE